MVLLERLDRPAHAAPAPPAKPSPYRDDEGLTRRWLRRSVRPDAPTEARPGHSGSPVEDERATDVPGPFRVHSVSTTDLRDYPGQHQAMRATASRARAGAARDPARPLLAGTRLRVLVSSHHGPWEICHDAPRGPAYGPGARHMESCCDDSAPLGHAVAGLAGPRPTPPRSQRQDENIDSDQPMPTLSDHTKEPDLRQHAPSPGHFAPVNPIGTTVRLIARHDAGRRPRLPGESPRTGIPAIPVRRPARSWHAFGGGRLAPHPQHAPERRPTLAAWTTES